MSLIAVTGASGFIGSHIAELFSKENIPIKCLVRNSSDISFLKHLNVEIVEGNITFAKNIEAKLKTDVSKKKHFKIFGDR